MEETDKFIDSHEDMHNRARCAFLYDLESVGVAGMLGPVSSAAHMLPGEPKLGPPDEVHPPKDPMMRAAQVAGMRTYLVRIHQKLRIPTIPPCCSEGRRPVVPKDSGRVFRVIAATCSE